MSLHAVLLPVFAHVVLVFGLIVMMGQRRLAAVRGGEVRRADVIMGQKAWPPAAQQASNAFSNQFELPALFYPLVILALMTRKADLVFVIMSWVFVAARYIQAGAYVTRNVILVRFASYAVGAVTLFAMWIIFAVRILSTPLPA